MLDQIMSLEPMTSYDECRQQQVAEAKRLRDEGMSLTEVAKNMGFENDSSVRIFSNEGAVW